ncbi:MAG: hypothetical protein JWM59_3277 [Verrucomicrobiales bacterium]|nr:hypothetical protein [Verrucomicrobiales bacterium]
MDTGSWVERLRCSHENVTHQNPGVQNPGRDDFLHAGTKQPAAPPGTHPDLVVSLPPGQLLYCLPPALGSGWLLSLAAIIQWDGELRLSSAFCGTGSSTADGAAPAEGASQTENQTPS